MLAAASYHLKQSAAGSYVVLVGCEMLSQGDDALGQQGHLVGRATGVLFIDLVISWIDCFFAHVECVLVRIIAFVAVAIRPVEGGY